MDVYMQFDVAGVCAAVLSSLAPDAHLSSQWVVFSKQTLVVTRPLLLCVGLQTRLEIHILTGARYM